MIRIKTYDLTCYDGEHQALVTALDSMAALQQDTDRGKKFVMPGAKVTIHLRRSYDSPEKFYMDVMRTTLLEPSYVKSIVKRLRGREGGSSSRGDNSSLVDLFLADSYHEFQERKKR